MSTDYKFNQFTGTDGYVVSGPLVDRIDIHLEVPAVPVRELSARRPGSAAARSALLPASAMTCMALAASFSSATQLTARAYDLRSWGGTFKDRGGSDLA